MVGMNCPVGKKLNQHIPHPHQRGREDGGVGAPSEARDIVAKRLPQPEGQMGSRGATRCHLEAELLGQKGLPPGGHAGHAEATCQPRIV
jgi:hypothetical protein